MTEDEKVITPEEEVTTVEQGEITPKITEAIAEDGKGDVGDVGDVE